MRDLLNCPNCGASINGCKCDYCGTQFYDLADIDCNNPCYIRFRPYRSDQIYELKVVPINISIDGGPYEQTEIDFRFTVLDMNTKKKTS